MASPAPAPALPADAFRGRRRAPATLAVALIGLASLAVLPWSAAGGSSALGLVLARGADPWPHFAAVPALDGPDWRLHWGVGGGPRLRWGDALLIRADFAYAPLGAELGMAPAVYVDVDQVL